MQDRRDRRRWPRTTCAWLCLVIATLAHPARATAQTAPPPAPTESAPAVDRAPPPAAPLANADVPAYYFSPLRFTGRVSDDGSAAELVAEVDVNLTRDAGWYDVPLKMGQAIVTGLTYEGPRAPIPREPTDGIDDGLHWLFQGRGVHHLRLNLRVPLRHTPNGVNLQLTVPSSASLLKVFPTQLELHVPAGAQLLEPAKDHLVEMVTAPTGDNRVVATIKGTRIDLSWRVVAERNGTLSRSVTAMTLQRDGERLRLSAAQDIAADGRISDVVVRLPTDFRLITVGGPGYVSHAPIPDQPGWVRVEVKTTERMDVQLEWELDADFPVTGGAVVLDGFEVRNAVRQMGTIAIATMKGYRVFRQRSEEQTGDDVKREDVTRVRSSLLPSDLGSAYALLRQPFELTLNLQEQRLVLETRPRAVVTTAADGITLDVDYQIRVDAGVAKELRLHWPEQSAHDWTFRVDSSDFRVIDATDASSDFPGEVRKIELPEGREGEFNVRLQFHAPDPPGPFELTLPVVESDRHLPAWLVLRGRDSVEPKLTAAAPLPRLTDSDADAWLKEQGYDADHDAAYIWENPQSPLPGESVLRALELKASTTVQLIPTSLGRFRVEQRVDCDVHYGRISEWRFRAPSLFAGASAGTALAGVQARGIDGRLLTRSIDSGMLLFALPEPAQGAVGVVLEYYLPVLEAGEDIEIPIFQLASTPYHSTQVAFPESGTLAVNNVAADWQPVSTAAHPVFVTNQAQDEFTARLNSNVAAAPQSYSVRQVFARVADSGTGRTNTAVDFHMVAPPNRILLKLPADAEGPVFQWNGRRIEPAAPMAGLGEGRYELPVDLTANAEAGHLRVTYQRNRPGGFHSLVPLEIVLPELPASVDVAETYLELQLPGDHCLFTYPSGMTPQFQWQPGLIFQRVLTPDYQAHRREALPVFEGDDSDELTSVYAFHTIGAAPSRHTFRVVGVWMLILFGSGLTLALAFLLWTTPATRNVLTVLFIGFVVAAAGVFAAEAVELLLQPVLLGLLAAAVAISMQAPIRPDSEEAWQESSTRSTPPTALSPSEAAVASTHVRPLELQESGSRE